MAVDLLKKLLETRRQAKKKKPTFLVKESKFNAGVKARWRFPWGRHSKVRQMHRGRPAMPNPGYSSPREVKGLHLSGLEMVIVHNADELNALGKEQGAVLAKISKKKKIELLELAQAKHIAVLNVKDVVQELKKLKSEFEERKKLKKEMLSEAGRKEEEKRKKAEEKKKKDEEEKKKEKEEAGKETEEEGEAKEAGREEPAGEELEKTKEEEQKEIVEKTMIKRQ